jgi:hypothetical protein
METAGVVQAAREIGLPWVAVRAVVDGATDRLPVECLATLRDDGHVAAWPLIRTLCRSPSLLRHLLKLARGETVARRCLSRVVACWAVDLQAYDPPV